MERHRSEHLESLDSLLESGAKRDIHTWFEELDIPKKTDVFLELYDRYTSLGRHAPRADRRVFTKAASLQYDEGYDGHYTGFGTYGTDDELDDDDPRRLEAQVASLERVEPEPGHIDISADAYMLKGFFSLLWELYNVDKQDKLIEAWREKRPKAFHKTATANRLYWTDEHWYTEAGGTNELKVSLEVITPLDARYYRWDRAISSQLLLSRLIAVFGMPPLCKDLDEHKQTWSLTLYWALDDKAYLWFYEWKGTFKFEFEGGEAASTVAQALIKWLVSDNVPHPWNYTVAGGVA